MKEQFLKTTKQLSYDPKAYTKFLESQLENFNQFQLSLNTTTESVKTLQILHNQQEERISSQTRIISLMQQVLEKQKFDQSETFSAIKHELSAVKNNSNSDEFMNFKISINQDLTIARSAIDILQQDHTLTKQQFEAQISDITQNIENLQNFIKSIDLKQLNSMQNLNLNELKQSVLTTVETNKNQQFDDFEKEMKNEIQNQIKNKINIMTSEIVQNLNFEIKHAIEQIVPQLIEQKLQELAQINQTELDFKQQSPLQNNEFTPQLPPKPLILPMQTSSITSEQFNQKLNEIKKPLNDEVIQRLQQLIIQKFDREAEKEIAMEDLKSSVNGIGQQKKQKKVGGGKRK